MRIGIVTSYATKQPAGLERFLLELLRALDVSVGIKYMVYVKKGTGLAAILKENDILNVDVIEVGFDKFWKDIGLFFAPRADAYIFNGPVVPFCFAPKNYFVILHDFAYRHIQPRTKQEKFKALVMDFLTRKAIQRARKIITVSETTKYQLVELFGEDPKHIATVYPGFKRVCHIREEPVPGVNEPYFLYIGTLKERKNVLSVIKAFSRYKKDRKDNFTLVIVGKKNLADPYVRKLFDLIEKESLTDSIIFTGHISDAQISFVYQHARALVFPSLLEGFGFPVLEAMSCKVPVITSNTGSLKEVCQDAAILINPLAVAEITAAMKQIADDEELRAKLVANGLKRADTFHWSRTAQKLQQLVVDNSVAI